MTVNDQPPDEPGSAGGLPEIRLKPGFKNPGQSASSKESEPQEEKPSRNGPLSFDDMLEFTSRPAAPVPQSIIDQPEPKRAPPAPPAPPAPRQPSVPPPLPSLETEPVAREFPTSLPSGLGGFELPPQPSFPPQPNFPSPGAHPNPLLMMSKDKPDRTWIKYTGLGVLGLIILAGLIFAVSTLFGGSITVRIKSKPSGAEVYLAEELLGKTPLKVELADIDERPLLKLEGYESQTIPSFKEPEPGKISKVYVVLKRVPFPADWAGLPKGTRVWWEGKEAQPKSIVAGEHKVKVKPSGQSSFIWSLTIPWKKGEEYPIGEAIAKEIKRRPTLKLSLSGAAKANVIVKDGPRFTKTLSLSKTPALISVPASGKYSVIVKATGENVAFKKEIALKEGSQKSVEIKLWKPRAAPTRTYNQNPSRPYRPSRPRYNPPPPVYHGGGGGGGQIAPPSF